MHQSNSKNAHRLLEGIGLLVALLIGLNLAFLYDPAVNETPLHVTNQSVSVAQNVFYDLKKISIVGAGANSQPPVHLQTLADGTQWDQAEAQSIVASNQAALQLFDQAAGKPGFRDPLLGDANLVNHNSPLSQLGSFRSSAYLAIVNAELLRRSGHEAEAVVQGMEVVQLGQTVQQSQSFGILWLVSTSMKQTGLRWLQRDLSSTGLSSAQLLAIRSELDPMLANTEGLRTSLKLEGLAETHGYETLRNEARENFGFPSAVAFVPYSFQPNRTAGYKIDDFQTQIANVDRPCGNLFATAQPNLSAVGYVFRYASPNGAGKWLVDLGSRFGQTWQYTRCGDSFAVEATQLTASLQAYRKDKGNFPQRLSDLVPAYMPAILTDPYDGRPLQYDAVVGTIASSGKDLPIDGKYKERLSVMFK